VSGNLYRGHRFPKEIISYCVWFYFRFGVSFREVEEMMASRGVYLLRYDVEGTTVTLHSINHRKDIY
jgi:transposase-like protein